MFADGVMESSSTTGTDDYVLTGSVYNGFTFSQKYADEDPVAFIAQTLNRSKFEIIKGSFDLGPPRTLRRTTVLASSAAGAKIDWQADDVYYIASFASADALAGFCRMNLGTSLPWWMIFGLWFRQDFPSANLHTLNLWDKVSNIKFGVVDTVLHVFDSVFDPAGEIQMYAGTSPPPRRLFCRGQSLLRTAYPALFDTIGTTYGAADGTHFSLPDLRGRVPLGLDPSNATGRMGAFDVSTLGNASGDTTQVATTNSTGATSPVESAGGTGGPTNNANTGSGSSFSYYGANDHTHTVGSTGVSVSGTSGAFSIVQPYYVINFTISTGGV